MASLKVLSFGNEKKNGFFFCISLTYSYLCDKVAKIRHLGRKKNALFLFYSRFIRIFAPKHKNNQ